MKTIKGTNNIKDFLLKLLEENTNKEMKSILTGKPLVYYFGENFSEEFMQKRVERNIKLQSLRLTEKNYDTEKHSNYSEYLKEIKHVLSYEKLDGDVIFLVTGKVIVFDIQNMSAEIYDSESIIQKYNDIFEKYWNKKQEA